MRKRLITPIPQAAPPRDEGWLDMPPILAVKPSGQWKCWRPLQARHSGRSPRCDSHLRGDFLKSVNCTQGKLTTVYRNDETSIALRMGISIPVMASISEAYL